MDLNPQEHNIQMFTDASNVGALRYYLDKTKDLRRGHISFKKGHTTDIRPATVFMA